MSAIDPAKAVDVMARLESIIRGADPEFRPPPNPAGIKTTLGSLAVTREHAAAAMAVGQNAESLVDLARRQMAEVMTTIKNITFTMPAADGNAATINSLIKTLTN